MKELGIKKLYYSISEVSKLTGLEQYILRYWETEFEDLKPSKNRAGNRIYTNKDIQVILRIKKLLREEKYTVEGARKVLLNFEDPIIAVQAPPEIEIEKKIEPECIDLKKDLEEIKNFLVYLHQKI